MSDAVLEEPPLQPPQTRALIYLSADPAAAEVCRMDLTQQRHRCAAWAAARSWQVVEELIEEPSAPAIERLRAAAREHTCEVVITPALICLGHEIDIIVMLLDALAQHGVDLVSLHESLDTASPHGAYALLLVRALARIGRRPGGPAQQEPPPTPGPPPATRAARRPAGLPLGYRATAAGVAIDPDAAPMVRRIFRLRDAGATVAELAQLLRDQGGGRWSQRALAVVLAHEADYRGGPHPDGGRWPALLEDR